MSADRFQLARDAYGAYESGDREVIERLLSEQIRRVEVYFGWDLD